MKHGRRVFVLFMVFVLAFSAMPAPVGAQTAPVQPAPVQPVQQDTVLFTFQPGSASDQLGVGESGSSQTLDAAVAAADASTQPVADMEPDGPQALLFQDGKFSILDTLNGRVLQFDPLVGQPSTLALPEGYFADMRGSGADLYLNNPSQGVTVKLAAAGAERSSAAAMPETVEAEQAAQLFGSDGDFAGAQSVTDGTAADSERVDDHHQRLVIFDAEGVMLATLTVETEHYLGSVRYLGRDAQGNSYVMVEEVLEGVEAIIAETSVRRYSPDALLLDAARLPLEEVYFLPNRPVAIDPAGGAYFLLVKQDVTQIVRLGFNPSYTSRLEERWKEVSSSAAFQAASDAAAQAAVAQGAVAQGAVGGAELMAATPVTRQQVIQSAAAYMNVNWTLSAANYYTGQAGNWNNCSDDKVRRENWRLPRYLTGRVGQVIAQVPYAWGGYQSIANFTSRLSQGNWAGNTCGREVRSNVAGVDCSGYVSQVLQLGAQYTTYSLPQMANRIRWDELRPGDFLLTSGHVMLFDKFDNGRNTDGGIWVYESTTRYQADRVSYNKLTFSYITSAGYAPWRAKNIVDDGPPVRQNLIVNGDFSNALNQWGFWGEINYANRDGALYMNRQNPSPNAAAVYQDFSYPLEAGSPMELTFSMGNISAVDKTFRVGLHPNNTWNGTILCSFSIPANSDLKTFRLAGKVPERWAVTRLEWLIDSPDGQPSLVMDNVSVKYRPDLNPSGVECSVQDPPPAYNMILDHYTTGSGWVKTDTENPVHCSQNQGNLYYNRTNRGGDLGAAHWWINVPSDGYYEVFAYMPYYDHYMNVTPHARYWVEYEGMPAGGPSQLVVLDQNQNLCQWVSLGTYRYVPGRSYGVYMGVGNIPYSVAVPNLIAADRVMVVPVGNPDRTPPDGSLTSPTNGAVVNRAVPQTTIALAANASDASSGVGRVEFHVRYDGAWHSIGTDTTAPYGMNWQVPNNIAPQDLTFTIHVIDRTGNETMDPGGYRTVTYKMAYRSSGFNLANNGYSFANFGDTQWTDFTLTDLVNMIGKDQACSSVLAGICVSVKQEVRSLYNDITAGMSGGHCLGMSVTSLRFFKAIDLPSNFQLLASNTSDLLKINTSVRRNITWYQARQYLNPIKPYLYRGAYDAPVYELYRLYDAFSANQTDQPVLVFANLSNTGAHAVTPYSIEDRGAGIYWVHIYDNNFPGNTTLYVQINTQANTWNYPAYGADWSGNATTRTLGVLPISLFVQPTGPLANNGMKSWAASMPDGSAATELRVNGTNQVLVSDASGRRLGFDNGTFVEEIPEAKWIIYPGSTGSGSPDIIVPADTTYEVKIAGPAAGTTDALAAQEVSLTRYGPGFVASIDQISPAAGSNDTFTLAADGSAVVFTPGSNASHPTLSLAQDGAGSNIQVTVENAGAAAGQPVLLSQESGRFKLDYSQAGQGVYNLDIERFSGGKEQFFSHSAVTIQLGDIHYLDVSDWDGSGSLTLEVDENGDGNIDQRVRLFNEYIQTYLPMIVK